MKTEVRIWKGWPI